MLSQLIEGILTLVIAINLFVVKTNGKSSMTFHGDNVTYTEGDINATISVGSAIQCVVSCKYNSQCAAIEYKKEMSECLILTSAVNTDRASIHQQYIKEGELCSEDWRRYGQQCFHLTSETYDRPTCSEMCLILGGTLVTDSSREMSNFVNRFRAGQTAWIGGLRHGVGGTWDSGSPLEYFNWLPGQPEQDNCILYYENSVGWATAPCSSKHHCLCERDI